MVTLHSTYRSNPMHQNYIIHLIGAIVSMAMGWCLMAMVSRSEINSTVQCVLFIHSCTYDGSFGER